MGLLDRLRAGLVDSTIRSANVGPPPAPFDQEPGSVWITYRVAADPNAPEKYLLGYWQGLVISGLFAHLSHGRSLPPLSGHSFISVAPDGTESPDSSSVVVAPPDAEIAPGSEGLVRAALARGAHRSAGEASVARVRFDHPGGAIAPTVEITVADPATFLADRTANVWSLVSEVNDPKSPLGEGAFVVVRDPKGALVTASGYSVRTRQGGGVVGAAYRDAGETSSLGGLG